jgi:catechol 2,3-dioxygenase-like lactoylglutathione lyase family enzyme
MKLRRLLLCFLLPLSAATAQLASPNDAGVAMGHIHLATKDVDAQKTFWISMMGGELVKNGQIEMIQFPGVYIMLRPADPKGPPLEPPAGSIVNHFGFVVKDMPGAIARWKAANLKIEPTENPNEVYVYAPDGVRVEVYGVPSLPTAAQMNHIHIYTTDVLAMREWYVKVFGATASQRMCVGCVTHKRLIETGEIPGVNLSFDHRDPPIAPTKGRAIDHIGFEVKDLDAFAARLEAQGIKLDVPIRQIPNSKLKIAFLTDPWGTYIELTQGLAPAAN